MKETNVIPISEFSEAVEYWILVEDSEKAILRIFWQNDDDDGQLLEALFTATNIR